MRLFSLVLGLLLIVGAFAQQSPAIFLKVRTDVIVIVRKHNTGADLVEITAREPNYPAELLRSQIEKMCQAIGTPARGLAVGSSSAEGSTGQAFVRASFATNGIISNDGKLNIQPILRAFAGAPPPYTVKGLTLEFDNVAPSATTIQRYSLPEILNAEGRFTNNGPLRGIEYRVQLLSQDSNKIEFPNRYSQAKPKPKIVTPSAKNDRMPLMILFIVAGIAAGALVYFAMLRSGSKAHS